MSLRPYTSADGQLQKRNIRSGTVSSNQAPSSSNTVEVFRDYLKSEFKFVYSILGVQQELNDSAGLSEADLMGIAEGLSSDSDDDVYTKSVDIRKVRGVVPDVILPIPPEGPKLGCNGQKESTSKDVVVIDEDDSLDLPDPDFAFSAKAKRSRRQRVEQLTRKELLELEEILSEPVIQIPAPCPKRTRRADLYDYVGISPDKAKASTSFEKPKPSEKSSSSTDVIELDKEVNLFVTVFVEQEKGKTGRFMSILRDEPFDKLRPAFAKELKCNQLDVMIHVNNVDAGPGDTPDSMGLDIEKLALVNVFCLRPNSNSEEDLSTDPSYIPVKCIFESGRPRCVYIKLSETFAEAKKRIKKALNLPKDIEKLVFDNDVLGESDTPQSTEMEAEDVVEIHIKKS
ncbi:hypothetical protein Aduo_001621 [Ancylostoma duodenale]